jgi:transcriptional regulator with XRE-family HTH domain
MTTIMPQPSRLKLPPMPSTEESLGERLARLRKERGYTQSELADRMGIIQAIVSSYERERIRPHADMIVRYALALDVTTDEILGLARESEQKQAPLSRRVLRRLREIERLPKRDRDAVLRTLDAFLARMPDQD